MNAKVERRIINDFYSLLKDLSSLTKEIKYEQRDDANVITILLYYSILNFTNAFCSLFKCKNYWAAPVILRSISELFVNFANIIKDVSYISSIEYDFLVQHKKNTNFLMSCEKDKSGEIFKKYESEYKLLAELIKKYEENNSVNTQIKDKFDLWQGGYGCVYGELCSHSHSNLNILKERHIMASKSNTTLMCVDKKMDVKNKAKYILTALSIVHDASMCVVGKFDVDSNKFPFNKYNNIVRVLREYLV